MPYGDLKKFNHQHKLLYKYKYSIKDIFQNHNKKV
jgi:hypothetical protein